MKGILVSSILSALVFASTPFSAFAMMTGDAMMTTSKGGSIVSESNLMVSSEGDGVTWLQTWLETKGYLVMPQGVAKGYFGNLTKMALAKYQSEAGLPSTGFYGPMTRAKLKGMSADMSKDTMSGSMNGGVKDTMMNTDTGIMVGGAMMIRSRDIVDNAVLASNVTTVVAAVKAAGLVDTLKSAGPFTVFAPTNAAFAKLPAGTVDTLLKPENKSQLVDILTYHVVAGRYTNADLTEGLVLKTVEGKTLKFHRDANGLIWINGSAMVETTDVISSNGVTHVINGVLLPSQSTYMADGVEVGGALMVRSLDIVDNAVKASNVTTVVAAVKAAGLVDTLKGAGPFTVFAPNNAAFAKLPAGTVDSLLKPENKSQLVDILTYHVVAGRYKMSDLTDGLVLKTVEGKMLTIKRSGTQVWINGAAMIDTPDVISSNGVTHVIDTVLIPK